MAKKKKRSRQVPSSVYYIVQITNWDWSYGEGVLHPARGDTNIAIARDGGGDAGNSH